MPSLIPCTQHRLSPVALQVMFERVSCPPMSVQPLEWQERWESTSITGRGAIYLAEMVLIPTQQCSATPIPCPRPAACSLGSHPHLARGLLPPALLLPAIFTQAHPGSLLTPWPGFLQSLALHGAAPGCCGSGQHCWVPGMRQEGSCPGHTQACPHNTPEIQRCMPKSKEPSHQGICLV